MANIERSTATEWERVAKVTNNQLITALEEAKLRADQWNTFANSRTDAQIAADWSLGTVGSKTGEQIVADIRANFAAFDDLYDAANNVAVPQLDRFFAMRQLMG